MALAKHFGFRGHECILAGIIDAGRTYGPRSIDNKDHGLGQSDRSDGLDFPHFRDEVTQQVLHAMQMAYSRHVAGYFLKENLDDLVDTVKAYVRGNEFPSTHFN